MGTRSGDLDPAAVLHVARESGASLAELEAALNTESGLEGLCGVSDMRDALECEASGDERARLAIDVYAYRIRKYIGAYFAALGGVDAVAFTAGVGENSPDIRERVCKGLERLGIEIDPARNRAGSKNARAISAAGSDVALLVVPTNEELEIADQTLRCIAGIGEAALT
jgi:acetate kinase